MHNILINSYLMFRSCTQMFKWIILMCRSQT